MSSVYLSSDENDLDDAELWAVIDSAAAAHSAAKSNSRRSVIPFRQIHTSVSPNSEVTPAHRIFRNPRHVLVPENDGSGSSADGEVLQYRPRKMARPGGCTGDRSISSSKQIVSFRVNPITSVGTSSSPKRPQSCIVQEMYPVVENLQIEPSRQLPNVGYDASLFGRVPSVSLFKQYQNAAMEILEKGDYTMIGGHPFIKKTGWRKISFFFNVSFEIKDKSIEFDQNRDVQRAEFVVRASMQGGRFSDGWGSCYRGEKRFTKPNHDIPSTAETRAKNKACQDLLGIGEYRPGVGNNGVR